MLCCMMLLFVKRMLAGVVVLAAALTIGACGGQVAGGAGGKNAFDDYLAAHNLVLPKTIRFDDFDDACRRRGLLKSAEYLASIGITIHGSGDGRYLSGNALRRACGGECTPAEGLGDVLADLTTYNITDR